MEISKGLRLIIETALANNMPRVYICGHMEKDISKSAQYYQESKEKLEKLGLQVSSVFDIEGAVEDNKLTKHGLLSGAKLLIDCDFVIALDGYINSPYPTSQIGVARAMGMPVISNYIL